jgi:hypothetical protein
MTVTNNFNGQAVIDFNQPNTRVFALNPARLVVNGGQQGVIEFSFSPTDLGAVQERIDGTLALPDREAFINTTLRGTGIEGGDPVIAVEPMEVSLSLQEPGQSAETAVTVTNEGEGRLFFGVELAEDVDWLSITPVEGLLRAGEAQELTVSTTANVPERGVHETEFIIRSNDPENEEIAVSVELGVEFFVEFVFDLEEITRQVEPDFTAEVEFEVANGGNAALNYQIDRRLVGDANIDPWSIRVNVNAEEVVDDAQLNGVTVVDGMIYVSGGNNGENINKIYVFDAEGEYQRTFDQFFESRYGMRDLTYDGNLIWGADATTLYGFTAEGELEQTIEGHARSYRALAWDADREVFWSADVTSDIFATNLEGDQVGVIDVPVDTRIYGLSYWVEDPDGYNLYVFTRGAEVALQINKIDVESGDMVVVGALDMDGTPGGIDITNQFDVFNWVLATMIQGTDRVVVWQLAGRRDWFQVEPEVGAIAVDESGMFTLLLNSEGFPVEIYRGELVFSEIYGNAEARLPVTMDVVEGRIPGAIRELSLEVGWNLVSVNVQPDEPDVEVLLADLVENNQLIMMKDDMGRFYAPEFGHNSLEGWLVSEGYMLKLAEAATLTVVGESVLFDDPIEVHDGWQMVSYYPRFAIEATVALSGIADHLLIAKDGLGNFYVPAWDYSNMGDLIEGQGYYLKLDADDELVYQAAGGDEAAAGLVAQASRLCNSPVAQASCLCSSSSAESSSPRTRGSIYDMPGRLPVHAVTGENMSLLVKLPPLSPPRKPVGRVDGDIGVYAGDALVGSGVLCDGVCGIAVWGDDPTTPEVDGALDGQALTLMLSDADGDADAEMIEVGYKVLAGEMVYKTDALAVVELNASSAMPTEFAITGAYPNPFNSATTISYSLPEQAQVSLKLYDISGREVETLVDKSQKAGNYAIPWNATDFPSGVYICRLDARNEQKVMKLALIR